MKWLLALTYWSGRTPTLQQFERSATPEHDVDDVDRDLLRLRVMDDHETDTADEFRSI